MRHTDASSSGWGLLRNILNSDQIRRLEIDQEKKTVNTYHFFFPFAVNKKAIFSSVFQFCPNFNAHPRALTLPPPFFSLYQKDVLELLLTTFLLPLPGDRRKVDFVSVFKIESYYIALTILEFTIKTRMAWNLQRSTYTCHSSSGIKVLH